jgi:hypothetical protein
MSTKWVEPTVKEFDYSKPPSIWISVIAFVVIYVAAFVITVLTWKQGQPLISTAFLVRVLVVPLLLWGGAVQSELLQPRGLDRTRQHLE